MGPAARVQSDQKLEGGVVVRGDASGFAQEIMAGPHHLMADEPVTAGGTDTGPSDVQGKVSKVLESPRQRRKYCVASVLALTSPLSLRAW